MQFLLICLIFCVVLFLYIHIYFHLKTSDDLEVYEIDLPSKEKLEELCDVKQPVLFTFSHNRLDNCTQKMILDTYGAFDVKVRACEDGVLCNDDEELYMPLPFCNAYNVIHAFEGGEKQDKNSKTSKKYLIEKNADFLQETSLGKSFQYNDTFLRPYLVTNCNYDYMMASAGTHTPFRYELNYRNFFLVTEGALKVKLAPPKSTKYLYQIKDYENLEFRSPVNPWQVQANFQADFNKVKCLELTVEVGKVLFIPAFWWHSFEFLTVDTSVCCFKYKTLMNTIALAPQLFTHILQVQNVKRNSVKNARVTVPIMNEPMASANEPMTNEPIVNESIINEPIAYVLQS
jgi:hypothetical protein